MNHSPKNTTKTLRRPIEPVFAIEGTSAERGLAHVRLHLSGLPVDSMISYRSELPVIPVAITDMLAYAAERGADVPAMLARAYVDYASGQGADSPADYLAELTDALQAAAASVFAAAPGSTAGTSFAEAYAYLTDALTEAGASPHLLRTGDENCYVIEVRLGDGSLLQIGSDAGPLGQPGEAGRALEVVWYANDEATASSGIIVASAQPADVETVVHAVTRSIREAD